ncbi:MAG: SAM-dependent chlorinase/fluorinase [Candidatus Poribacteria bacterium]|nr:SAM-dependent chlorinase/fluorinase [Candidatus Poribacteria bacterium]
MSIPPRIITLTTDFGTSDAYVGVMKGVILGINPSVQVVDITHAVPPQDVHEAAFLINSAYHYFPKGTIHLIVVDPGVGSDRQAIVCQTDRAFFVCPDNGILTYLLEEIENSGQHPGNIVKIENRAYYLPEVSQTFHGRDIFAPVAAYLSLGVTLAEIGPFVPNLVRLPIPTLEISDDKLIGEIIKTDSFGNAITNISESLLSRLKIVSGWNISNCEIRVGGIRLKGLNRAYAESAIGKPLAIIGSSGLLEIAVNGGSAETILRLKRGDTVVIQRFN